MKYIKKFELINITPETESTHELKVGDYVKYIKFTNPDDDLNDPHLLYKIIKINIWSNEPYVIERIIAKSIRPRFEYAKKSELIYVPDYEVTANKYNL
jgi:hypothetical protein